MQSLAWPVSLFWQQNAGGAGGASGAGGTGGTGAGDGQGTGSATDQGAGAGDGQGQGSATDQDDERAKLLKMKPDELVALLDEARKGKKVAVGEASEHRKKLRELQEAEEKRKKAELTDLQRAQQEAKDWQGKHSALEEKHLELVRRSAITEVATRMKFIDPSDAYKLVDMAAIKVEDGEVDQKSVEEALKPLVTSKKYLIQSDKPPKGKTDGDSRPEGDKGPDEKAIRARFRM